MNHMHKVRKKGAVYGRISTDETRQSSTRQSDDLKGDAELYNYDILEVFNDQISGSKEAKKRPEFKRMVQFIKDNEIDCIFMTEISRLGRNNIDVLQTIEGFHKQGINLYFKENGGFTLDENGEIKPNIKFTLDILTAVADQERKQIQQRIKSAVRVKLGNGHPLGHPPFGYNLENKLFVPDPVNSELVRQIFEKFVVNKNIMELCNFLNNQKIKKNDKGEIRLFSPQSIRNILTNEAYTGHKTTYQREEHSKKFKRDADGNKVVNHTYKLPAIIDKSLFDEVNSILKGRKTNKRHLTSKYTDPLKGLFKCSHCNYPMVYEKKGNDMIYRCSALKRKDVRADKSYCTTIKAEHLLSIIIHHIKSTVKAEDLNLFKETRITEIVEQIRLIEAKINECNSMIDGADKTRLSYVKSAAKGHLTEEEKDNLIDELLKDVEFNKENISAYSKQVVELKELYDKLMLGDDNTGEFDESLLTLKNYAKENIISITIKRANDKLKDYYNDLVYASKKQVCYELEVKGILFEFGLLFSNYSNKYAVKTDPVKIPILKTVDNGKETIINLGLFSNGYAMDVPVEFTKLDLTKNEIKK